jgi:hypothetical protein
MKKHLPALATAFVSAAFLLAGIMLGHHSMIMSYAVIVCLSCIGIG